jgi:hypothetical protein
MATPGHPTAYKPEYCELAHNYCLLGATNEELAGFFGVARRTIDNWIATIPEFAAALKDGREIIDATVAKRLLSRALGYSHEAVRIMQYRGAAITVTYTQHYPPDTQACIFWLRNRRRQSWREKVEPAQEATVDMVALLEAAGEEACNAAGA